jgi:peptidoglycan/xylan/chitin deacetylase (PgdA/CDA1 family)
MPAWTWRRLRRVAIDEPFVVLTLDVGAKLENLEKVLDVLRAERVKTTVFLYTLELAAQPRGREVVRRMVADGHELANHTVSHTDLTKLEAAEVEAELDGVTAFIRETTGQAPAPYFREPFLAANDAVDAIVRERCYRSIWFTVDTGDWEKGVTAQGIQKKTLEADGAPRAIEPGSIFIFHGSQAENLEALPAIIATLRRRGFGFLTLSEALRRERVPAKANGRSGGQVR